MNPTQEYGWLIIDTPEKKLASLPKMPSDEFLNSQGQWESVAVPELKHYGGQFGSDHIYRRRIDPGKDWEIVPPEEIESQEMEFTRDGSKWEGNARWMEKVGDLRRAVSWYSGPEYSHSGILAFRRRKAARPQFGVAIKTSERKPTGNDAGKAGYVLSWDEDLKAWYRVMWNSAQDDYWMPQPPPPPEEKAEAEKAWEAWCPSHVVPTSKTAFLAGYEAAKNE